MSRRLSAAGGAVLVAVLTACGQSGSAGGERTEFPRQAPVTATTTTTIPYAPTTCTGGPQDPAACQEGEGQERLPSSL